MSYKYLIFLMFGASCIQKNNQNIENAVFINKYENEESDKLFDAEYITQLSFLNESLIKGHLEEIKDLADTYNLDSQCINHMLKDYLNFIRNDKQNYSNEFIEDLKYHYVDLYDFEEENLNEFFKAFDRRFTYLLEQ